MAFLSPAAASRGEDYSRLLASPAALLPSPLAQNLFQSPGGHKGPFAVQEGRLSFDVLLQEHDSNESSAGAVALEGLAEAPRAPLLNTARSASHLELFALGPPSKPAAAAAVPQRPSAQLQAALTQAVVAKTVAAKELEVEALVAGVAAKYGLAADYSKAEDTIKAVWVEQRAHVSRASSPAAEEGKQQQAPSQQQTAGGEEPTLANPVKGGSTDNMSCDEEAGQQATSALKPAVQAAGTSSDGGASLKRPLAAPATFSFNVTLQHATGGAAVAAAADDAALKRRRVEYDRMRELEAEVQRVRHLGDALKQSLRQTEAQHEAAASENEQLWNALLHIHASLRAAHAATLKQQVAMHAAAMAAALPPVQPQPTGPDALFGGMFSPADADDLAAACGMFISPAKPAAAAAAANNKPRKLFLEEEASKAASTASVGLGSAGPALLGGMGPELSPALWVQAA